MTKTSKPRNTAGVLQGEPLWETTIYIRDANGEPMATYRRIYTPGNGPNAWVEHLQLVELPLYGSSRLGVRNTAEERTVHFTATQVAGAQTASGAQESVFGARNYETPEPTSPLGPVYNRQRATKLYELTDHLGNVRATVTDTKVADQTGGFHFNATVQSFAEYFPFGSLLPGRNFSSSGYRFGFNGKENDNEAYNATGTSVDFGERMLDTRAGRWLSIDPKASKYPHSAPYLSMGNNPLVFIDEKGEDILIYLVYADGTRAKDPVLRIVSEKFVHEYSIETQLPNLDKAFGRNKQYGDPLLVNPFPAEPLTIDIRPFEPLMVAAKSDAFVIDAGAGFAFGGGPAISFSAIHINKGKDEGWHFYQNSGPRYGLDIGVGVQAGVIDFKENNSKGAALTKGVFEGKSQGWNFGAGTGSVATLNSYTDNQWHGLFKAGELLYEGVMVGGGPEQPSLPGLEFGVSRYLSDSKLLGSWTPAPDEERPSVSKQ